MAAYCSEHCLCSAAPLHSCLRAYHPHCDCCRYANRAKNIKNNARINEDPKDALLRGFQKEIELLKRRLEECDSSESEEEGETPSRRRLRSAGGLKGETCWEHQYVEFLLLKCP